MDIVKKIFSGKKNNLQNKGLMQDLHKTDLFKRLSHGELELVSELVHTRKYEMNELIFQKGDMGLGLFVIISGSVKIFNTPSSEIFYLKSGQTFGEHALVENTNVRTFSSRAAEVTELGVLLRPDLKDLMNTYPRIANKVLLSLCELISEELSKTKKKLRDIVQEKDEPPVKVVA